MFPKYLIVFGGVAVAGGAAATTFIFQKTDSDKEKKTELKASQPATISLEPAPLKKEEPKKSNFSGKLVFSKDNKKPGLGRDGKIFYEGKIFNNEEYKKKEGGLEALRKEDPDDHIIVKVNLEKPQKEIEDKLIELNKKIEEKFKEKNHSNLPLIKLEKSLEKLKNEFENIFGKNTYKELLEQIKELQKPKKATE